MTSACVVHVAAVKGDGFDAGIGIRSNRNNIVPNDMRAEPFRLLAHIVHQIRTHDAIGKAWEILHFGGVDQLAAGRQRAGDDQRLEPPRPR